MVAICNPLRGVSDANEIIQKFLTQEDTQKNLQQLTKENQETIDRQVAENCYRAKFVGSSLR